jgi:hypothetical protein
MTVFVYLFLALGRVAAQLTGLVDITGLNGEHGPFSIDETVNISRTGYPGTGTFPT